MEAAAHQPRAFRHLEARARLSRCSCVRRSSRWRRGPHRGFRRATSGSYEPKWDGFRCLAFRDGDAVELQSKSGEIADALLSRNRRRAGKRRKTQRSSPTASCSFPVATAPTSTRCCSASIPRQAACACWQRKLRPSTCSSTYSSRVAARFTSVCFARGASGSKRSSHEISPKASTVRLSPATSDIALAQQWLAGSLARLDGVIAKRDVPYAFGSRDAVFKIKRNYTADCVVGGFRAKVDGTIASLLLGLYDEDAKLHHVGFVGSMSAAERQRAATLLAPIVEPPGFTGAVAGRPEPLAARRRRAMVSGSTRDRRRGGLRSRDRAPLSPRGALTALASREAAASMHDGAAAEPQCLSSSTRLQIDIGRDARTLKVLTLKLPVLVSCAPLTKKLTGVMYAEDPNVSVRMPPAL